MNYYEHHIGDYAQATAHLSFIEDAAYSRLIRKYYAEERPLPVEVKAVQRLIGARSREERDAVESVLREFFVLSEAGWSNKRCDADIARYRDKQAKARRSAEARWHKGAPHSADDAREMRTHGEGCAEAMLTSSQTPDPRPQKETAGVALTSPAGPDRAHATRSASLCKRLRAQGIDAAPHMAAWRDLLRRYSDEEIAGAAELAAAKKPNERIHLHYLVPILADRGKPPSGNAARRGSKYDIRANYAAQAAQAREARGDAERDIDGEAVRID